MAANRNLYTKLCMEAIDWFPHRRKYEPEPRSKWEVL